MASIFCNINKIYCNRLKTKISLNIIYTFSLYRTINTLRLGYKCEAVNVKYIIPALSQHLTKHTNAICGQNIEFFTLSLVVHKVTIRLYMGKRKCREVQSTKKHLKT
jgi:hypothetical protein